MALREQTQPPSVVVLGGINMDLVAVTSRFPEAGETVLGSRFLTYPGGKGANQAVAAARMGATTTMVGRVGDDMFGPQLTDALTASDVDVSGIAVAPGVSSGIAVIEIDGSAQNRIVQIPGANGTCGEPEAARVAQAMAHGSTLLLQLEVSIELSPQVAQEAAALGKTVILDPGPVRPLPEEFYFCCDVITPNETEAQAADQLLARGVSLAVIKLGAQGAYYATTEGGQFVPPFPVVAVDSVAAGDTFNGALAATKSGAQDAMPTRVEVEALLQGSYR